MKYKNLLKSKTVWTAVTLVVASAAGYATGEITAPTAVQGLIAGLMAIFLRDAVNGPPS